jgi:hypothetical protein
VHVPTATNVIVDPFTPPDVHTDGVVVENTTVNPDDAVADTTTGDCANVLFANAPKLIVWGDNPDVVVNVKSPDTVVPTPFPLRTR